jgi:MFS-type transporter involved in bile tolerance (Atg22 family)
VPEGWEFVPLAAFEIALILAPFVGAGVLAALLWGWLKETVKLNRPPVLAGIMLSLLDIAIPLAVLLYVVRGLSGG